ncbi:MAG: hypothetical protein FWF54_05425 [Candidatus Azobacteroides sp.]|nr:hypothetical protein [Candidatus Azobacteroides sp.]
MKTRRIYILIIVILSLTGRAEASSALTNDGLREGKKELFTEKKTKSDEAVIWEKNGQSFDSGQIFSNDDDTKLYAPPPGENGNPQKIVAPLGNSDVAMLLLMSLFMAGYYCKKHLR